jgi:hypothetical protein
MVVHTTSCSSPSSAHRAWAMVTPIVPSPTFRATAGDNLWARVSRVATQPGFLPHSLAIPVDPSPCSWRRADTTRASSMAVSVRRGALAVSSTASASCPALMSSITTGT